MEKKRNGEIDVFRFIFSIIIVFYHFNLLYPMGFFPYGDLCVEFFFIVSGYLMAVQVEKLNVECNRPTLGETADHTWRFIIKRMGALFAYYISVVILHVIVKEIIINKAALRDLIVGFLRSIPTFTLTFMGLNYRTVTFYVGNTWFLSAMMIAMFILYPLILRNYKYSSKLVCPLMALFLLAYTYSKYGTVVKWEPWDGYFYLGVIRAVTDIALGISLRPLSVYITEKFAWLLNTERIPIKVLLTLAKLSCYAVVIKYMNGSYFGNYYSLHGLLFFALAILMTFTGVGYTLPGNKLTNFLAKISLPIFIYHGFIRLTCKDLLAVDRVTLSVFFVMVASSVIISVILMYITDFAMKLIKKIGGMVKNYALSGKQA